MTVILRTLSILALLLSASATAFASECGDPAARLVEINQRILQLLPPRAELTGFVLDDAPAARARTGCMLKISVAFTSERNAHAHAFADSLRKEPQVAEVVITRTRIEPPQAVHTELTLVSR